MLFGPGLCRSGADGQVQAVGPGAPLCDLVPILVSTDPSWSAARFYPALPTSPQLRKG